MSKNCEKIRFETSSDIAVILGLYYLVMAKKYSYWSQRDEALKICEEVEATIPSWRTRFKKKICHLKELFNGIDPVPKTQATILMTNMPDLLES